MSFPYTAYVKANTSSENNEQIIVRLSDYFFTPDNTDSGVTGPPLKMFIDFIAVFCFLKMKLYLLMSARVAAVIVLFIILIPLSQYFLCGENCS